MPDDNKSLLAQHNISPDGLINADKVGGLAVPSLAVVSKDLPLENFGSITLLASKGLIDPKGGKKAKVYGADIYSPRYPEIIHQYDKRNIEALNRKFNNSALAVGDSEFTADELDTRPINKLRDSTAVRHAFLSGMGIKPNIIAKKLTIDQKALLESKHLKPFSNEYFKPYQQGRSQEFINAYTKFLKEKQDGIDYKKEFNAEQLKNIANSGAYNLENAIKDSKAVADKYDTKKAINEQFNVKLNDEFETYIQGILDALNPKEKIFNGYTYSGSRRYIEHTIDNVVKLLKKDVRGGENWNYGLGNVRAMFTPEFKSIADIRNSKDKLITSDAFADVKNEQDDELIDLSEKLQPYHPAFSSGEKFGFLDSMTSMLSDSAKIGIPKALKDGGFDSVPEHLQEKIGSFLNQLRNMPTEYFEAKILRDVKLGEFSAAIVPKNTAKNVLNILKKHGINDITFYDENDNNGRKKAIASHEDLMFSRSNKDAQRTPFVAQNDEAYLPALNKITEMFKSGDKNKQQEAGNTPIPISRTPVVLRQILTESGNKPFKQADFVVGQGSTLYLKANNIHGKSIHSGVVSMDVLKNLPQLLADPIAVFKSSTVSKDGNSYKILIDAKDENGNPVIVAIKPNVNMQQLNNAAVNLQATIFPTTWKDIARWNKDGSLRYYNEKSHLVSVVGINPQEAATKVDTQEGLDATIGISASKVKVITSGDIKLMDAAFFSWQLNWQHET